MSSISFSMGKSLNMRQDATSRGNALSGPTTGTFSGRSSTM